MVGKLDSSQFLRAENYNGRFSIREVALKKISEKGTLGYHLLIGDARHMQILGSGIVNLCVGSLDKNIPTEVIYFGERNIDTNEKIIKGIVCPMPSVKKDDPDNYGFYFLGEGFVFIS